MNSIGGNITAHIQVKTEIGKDAIGKPVFDWVTAYKPIGFLDLMNGDSHYTNYNTKLQESTHIFICDWFPMNVKIAESRVVIDGVPYDLKLIDDPMEMHYHYELYLQLVG